MSTMGRLRIRESAPLCTGLEEKGWAMRWDHTDAVQPTGRDTRFCVRRWPHRYLTCIAGTCASVLHSSTTHPSLSPESHCLVMLPVWCYVVLKRLFIDVMDCLCSFLSLGSIWWTNETPVLLSFHKEEAGGEVPCAGDIFVLCRLCPL